MSRSGRKTLPAVWEWWEALPDAWELSGGPPGCPGVVGWPSRMSGSVRKALPDVREALSDVRDWSGGTLGCPGVVKRLSQISGSG